jgi:hypothetical protein
MTAGVGLLQHGAERAEHTTAGERLGHRQRNGFRLSGWPVRAKLSVRSDARTIVLFQQLAAPVVPRVGRCIGVGKHIDIGFTIFLDRDYTQLLIEARAPMAVALVPALQRFAGQPRQIQAPAGVDAVGLQDRRY